MNYSFINNSWQMQFIENRYKDVFFHASCFHDFQKIHLRNSTHYLFNSWIYLWDKTQTGIHFHHKRQNNKKKFGARRYGICKRMLLFLYIKIGKKNICFELRGIWTPKTKVTCMMVYNVEFMGIKCVILRLNNIYYSTASFINFRNILWEYLLRALFKAVSRFSMQSQTLYQILFSWNISIGNIYIYINWYLCELI